MTKKLFEWRWMLISLFALLPMTLLGQVSISLTSQKEVGEVLNCRLNDVNIFDRKDVQLEGSDLTIYWKDGTTEAFRTGDIQLKSKNFRIEGASIGGHMGFAFMKEVRSSSLEGQLWVRCEQSVLLNVSGCTNLAMLACSGGQLTSLDVRGCTNLARLYCLDNQLTNLDVSDCPNVVELKCSKNQLTTLDVRGCTNLSKLWCEENQLTALNLVNCPKLTELKCSKNQLSALDVTQCSNLASLFCFENKLTGLDVTQCPKLIRLSCSDNQLSALDVTQCPTLTLLSCCRNQLTDLDVAKCPRLTMLSCFGNKLADLDVTQCPNLTRLECYGNQLARLDVTKCPKLNRLYCFENQLTDLDVTQCADLTMLSCYHNKLAALDVSGCPNLTLLSCSDNQLIGLDVTKCPSLEWLECPGNQLTSLDIANCPNLTGLSCFENQLGVKAMDGLLKEVSNLNAFEHFICLSGNILTKKQHEQYGNIPFEVYSAEGESHISAFSGRFYLVSFGSTPVRIEGLEKEAEVEVAEGSILHLVALPGYTIESVNGAAYDPKKGYRVNSAEDANLHIKVVRKDPSAADQVKGVGVSIYPNPVVNEMCISVPNEWVGKTAYLYNMSGQLVRAIRLTEVKTTVEVSQLQSGQYLLRLGKETLKVMKR